MFNGIDILENDILEQMPEILDILLYDNTTNKNIFWATDNYIELGVEYSFTSPIKIHLITGINGNVIKPRIQKSNELKNSRSKDKAEVFTPSWVCNVQNNVIDEKWFNKKNIFNQILKGSSSTKWKTIKRKVRFPEGKTWIDYICDKRLEVSCGEAPYLTSRYDTTTGEFIEIDNRIGLLDRKLRIISENIKNKEEWFEYSLIAYKNIYGYEWQGDSLLLARESLLFTFIDFYKGKFNEFPGFNKIKEISQVISWNIWQMDGLKCVIPESCYTIMEEKLDLFNDHKVQKKECLGCQTNNIKFHNGIYCVIKNWKINSKQKKDEIIRFVDLIK
ncbi:restriction endonuclease subunit M [Myroides odoratimimus]|uniref:restriction endonuclease subunit M n=1 Tax=Myroides odoratimimus TaxID=76832 RepID=UPI00257842AD|nr:restriction endonuclease subunit M [Myroides odoratimimus]MDM1454884.1 restriction endonuclease subunit M [Myroides odoratimimus]MDM1478606.1 restriction endonuclease subunit M [Myroides odoratimimus]MDM1490946.1 restriction endonuclease subunit M [Myroides odoratimimus]